MEIETKIFDIKKVRKVLARLRLKPNRVCDVVDYIFDVGDFSAKNWRFLYPRGSHSGLLGVQSLSVEVPDAAVLADIQDFLSRQDVSHIKIRLRVIDTVPYITFKGPKKTKKGIKSREEIEVRIGSLSSMLHILLTSGAVFLKSITRIREIYAIPHHSAELVIDMFHSAHGDLEYVELECASAKVLRDILENIFGLTKKDISHAGITELSDQNLKKLVSKKLTYLAEITEK